MTRISYIIFIFLLTPVPAYAVVSEGMKSMMVETFGSGGKGFAISLIIILAIGSWIFEAVARAIGKSNHANWAKSLSDFTGLGIFVASALAIISGILSYVW